MKLKDKSQFLSPYSLCLLFLFLFALRALHLPADPPVNLDWSGGIFFDEGMLVHGARNKVLFGAWDLDGWNDFYISPILAYIKWLVLSIAGVGIVQERLIPLFFSYLTLIFFYLTFKESFHRKTAVLAVFLLGFNYIFIMFNRLGLTETSVVFFMVLTGYFWQRGFSRLPWAGIGDREPEADKSPISGLRPLAPGLGYFFLSGVSCFTAYIFKNFPYFLPVPVLAMLLSFRILPRLQTPRAEGGGLRRGVYYLLPAVCCLLGMLIPFLIWYVFFYLPYFPSIHQAMNYFKRQSLPRSWEQVLLNISHLPFFAYFMRTPVELFLSFLAIGYFIYLFFHSRPQRTPDPGPRTSERTPLHPVDLFMLCWYLMHFFMYMGLNYRPLRYYLPILPPMVALAARLMVSWSSLRSVTERNGVTIKIPERLSLGSVPFLASWLTLFLGYGFFPFIPRLGRFLPISPGYLTWERGMLASAGISLLILGAVAWICRKWRAGKVRPALSLPGPLALLGFLVLPLSASILINGYQYYQWAAHPKYVIRSISRELGSTLHHAFIAGLGAPMICLENTHRALHVFDNFFNYRTIFTRYRVTHLFMGDYNQEVEFYYRKFSYPMRRATLWKVYPIRESHFYLYSMVEPSVEKIQVAPPASSSPLEVTLSIKNNELTDPREVHAGWVLHPLDAGSGDITVTTPSPVSLKPLEIRDVPLSGEVPPGTYRLMAFTLPSYQNIFEAELLSHLIGEKQKDREASNGEAWKVRGDGQTSGYAVYGPYLRYPAGHLRVFFRLKTSDNTLDQPIAQVDIAADDNQEVLAARDLRGTDFKAPGAYEELEVSSFLEGSKKLEFRVRFYGQTDVWIDRIRVEFTRGRWYGQPITLGGKGLLGGRKEEL